MMGEAVSIALHDLAYRGFAPAAFDGKAVAEQFEMKIVSVAAAVQAEAQHDRYLERSRQHPWPHREGRALTEEVGFDNLVAGSRAIDEQCDQRFLIQRFLDGECGHCTVLPGVDVRSEQKRWPDSGRRQ